MIQLTNGHFQTAAGIPVAEGSLVLTLQSDASVIASPHGQVFANAPITIPLDSFGNISLFSQIWSNAELNPTGTSYLVNVYDSNGARLWMVPQTWIFAQNAGSVVDVGTIVPVG